MTAAAPVVNGGLEASDRVSLEINDRQHRLAHQGESLAGFDGEAQVVHDSVNAEADLEPIDFQQHFHGVLARACGAYRQVRTSPSAARLPRANPRYQSLP